MRSLFFLIFYAAATSFIKPRQFKVPLGVMAKKKGENIIYTHTNATSRQQHLTRLESKNKFLHLLIEPKVLTVESAWVKAGQRPQLAEKVL